MRNKNSDFGYGGLEILARIIARKFMADQQAGEKVRFDFGEKRDMPDKQALNKEGKAVAI